MAGPDPYDREEEGEHLYTPTAASGRPFAERERLYTPSDGAEKERGDGERLYDGSKDSPEALADKEREAGGTSATQKATDGERNSLANKTGDNTIGSGFKKEGTLSKGIKGGVKNKLRASITPRRAFIGGGLISFVVILILMFGGFSAFELINLRENLLGKGNRFTNAALQRRRASSFSSMLKKMSNGTFEQNINSDKFRESFRSKGFTVELDGNGRLTEFSFTASDGTKKAFDLASNDNLKATNDFFGDNGFGREASKAYDKALAAKGALWRGPFSRSVYKLYGFIFSNWADKAASDKAKTWREKLADKLRHAQTPQPSSVDPTATKDQLAKDNETTGPDGKPVLPGVTDGADLLTSASGMTPDAYRQAMLSDPTATEQVLGGLSNADADRLGTAVASGLDKGLNLDIDTVGKSAGKGALEGLAKGGNIIGGIQEACAVKGILNFVTNATNILVTIELARFAVNMLSAADNQKAGIMTAGGLALVMTYLHTKNPTTKKDYYASGGMQQKIGTNPTAKVSPVNLSKTSVGRGHPGVLGSISNFVNKIPGMNHCSVVNNGFVVAGGFVVGIGAAILTGGTSALANIATAVTLGIAKETALQIAIPLLIAASANMVINGYEDGEFAGDALASGFGAFAGMVAGGNGLRPSTKAQIAEMTPMVDADYRYEQSQQSVFARYFSPSNGESLVSHVAMAMPKNVWSLMSSLSSGGQRLFGNIGNLGIMNFFVPASAKAAAANTGQQCDDPQVIAHGVAADVSCNVIMANTPKLDLVQTERVLRAAGQIDDKGYPTTTKVDSQLSFGEYAQDCFKGRPSILYNEDPDQDGNEPAIDDTCIGAGIVLPGDTVGRYDRFAAWWGYVADRDEMVEQFQ